MSEVQILSPRPLTFFLGKKKVSKEKPVRGDKLPVVICRFLLKHGPALPGLEGRAWSGFVRVKRSLFFALAAMHDKGYNIIMTGFSGDYRSPVPRNSGFSRAQLHVRRKDKDEV